MKTKKTQWIEFKPSEKNMTKVLGDLEAAVIEALWKLQVGHVREIHTLVNQKRKVAITTIATILDRLYKKGLVERELKKGKGLYYEYRPALTKTQFETTVVKSVFKGLFEAFGDSAMSYLIDTTGIKDQKALEDFKRYLERLKQGLK